MLLYSSKLEWGVIMTYKTKFREIKIPENADELKNIGTDANSVRSYGAASYNSYPDKIGTKLVSKTYLATNILDFMHRTLNDPEVAKEMKNPDAEKRYFSYFTQGVLRAAKKAGDHATVDFITQKGYALKR
jgi:hypothetical protein